MAGYTYYRLYVSKFVRNGSTVSYVNLAEFALWNSDGDRLTDNVDYTATASSTQEGAVGNLFDNNASTIWHSNYSSAIPSWIQIKFDKPVIAETYGIMPRNSSSYKDYPYSWVLQVSDDGATWTDIDTHTDDSAGWAAATYRTFETGLKANEIRYLLKKDDTLYTVTNDKAMVDAIVFSGAESFATGIVPTQDTMVEITLNTGTFGGAAVGARTSEGADAFAIIPASSTTIEGLYGAQDVTATVDDYTDTDVTITLSADGLTLAGESIGTVDAEEFEASVGLTIGALNTAGTLESYFTGSIKSVIITQGEAETLHLVPCVDEERVACFYDAISKTCIYSDTEPGYTDESGAVDTAYKVSELDVTEITAEVFQTYGIEDASLITAKLVSEWTAFKVLKWTDGDTITLTVALTDTTPLPQTIISNAIYLDDPSILGIESVTATYEGNPKIAMSFDDKETWHIYTDEGWGLLSDETAGMSMETLLAITTEQWAEKITDLEKMYMRVVLSSLEDKVTEIKFDFVNL